MKITKKFLEIKNACDEGIKWFHENKPFKSDIDCIKKLMKNEIIINGDDERYNWSNWIICRIFDRDQRIKYAVYAAEQVLHIFEKKYPDDNRPREAIRAAKKVLKSNTEKNRKAAADAAYVAYAVYASAVYAAYAAAYAADAVSAYVYTADYADAAADAAYVAYAASAASAVSAYVYTASAADAAADAVSADADYADAAQIELQIKIINYGLKLLK